MPSGEPNAFGHYEQTLLMAKCCIRLKVRIPRVETGQHSIVLKLYLLCSKCL
jgi:hypothetical protein